ncbi:hypothetical protein BDV19DRAFT_374117 [Aspergillus venezuelensis]
MEWPDLLHTTGKGPAPPLLTAGQLQPLNNAMPLQTTFFGLSNSSYNLAQDGIPPPTPLAYTGCAGTFVVPGPQRSINAPNCQQQDRRISHQGVWTSYPLIAPYNLGLQDCLGPTPVHEDVAGLNNLPPNIHTSQPLNTIFEWNDNPSILSYSQCKWEGCTSNHPFPRVGDLIRHIKTILIAPDAHRCTLCRRAFGGLGHLQENINRLHSGG